MQTWRRRSCGGGISPRRFIAVAIAEDMPFALEFGQGFRAEAPIRRVAEADPVVLALQAWTAALTLQLDCAPAPPPQTNPPHPYPTTADR